ncbi:PilW family protein [Synechococcus sp. CC9616]|uniref:PilW family protein n=1 Tax=Synechococcus sp. CC9616 TaxID=110663 RepID=UPI00049013ED|nr:hypothetical protein [Synechococcus sp. CC9616]
MIKFFNQHGNQGLTFIELLVAAAIGLITVMAGGQVMVSQIDSSQKMSRRERLRSDWVAANQFITSEVNQSMKVTTEADDELIEECGIVRSQIKMVIQFQRNQQIKPAIYYTTENDNRWSGIILKRCGPAINSSGDYDSTLSNEIIIDELENNDSGFTASISEDEKLVQFNIALNGLVNARYRQQGVARSRIQTVIVRPNISSVCFETSQQNIKGIRFNLTSNSDQFTSEQNQDQWNRQMNADALICGHGGGDTITGGDGNNLIEAGGFENSVLDGGGGDDRIIGSDGNDEIDGGDGDDILIGLGGDDTLRGGSGTNHFISGIDEVGDFCDHDKVIGQEDSYDIIYFEGNTAEYEYERPEPCTQASCRITKKDTDNKKNVDVEFGNILVFANEVFHIPKGEAGNLQPLNRDSCDVEVTIHEPPEAPEPEVSDEDDPRWLPLIEAKTIGFNILNSVKEEYTRESRRSFIANWSRNIRAEVEDLPQDVKDRFCFTPTMKHHRRNTNMQYHSGSLILARKINGACAYGVSGSGLLSTRIRSNTSNLQFYGQVRMPKDLSYEPLNRSCNIQTKFFSNPNASPTFREARGC